MDQRTILQAAKREQARLTDEIAALQHTKDLIDSLVALIEEQERGSPQR